MNIKHGYMGWRSAATLLAVVMMGVMNGFAQPDIPAGSSKNLSGSLFYKARHPETGNMWDVWLYHHEGTYYLYYLANAGPKPPKGQPWNNISLATSPDGVNWTEKGALSPICRPLAPL